MSKTLYIIAGCNGAGKTTASFSILPTILKCKEFINADEIARGLSPFKPESMAIQAGRIMLERIGECLKKGLNFAIETTLSGKSYIRLIEKATLLQYKIELIFFTLDAWQTALERVKKRVNHGGHSIPKDVIKRRYYAGIKNLLKYYIEIVHQFSIYNNNKNSILIADGTASNIKIYNEKIWKQLNKIKDDH
jgi:predicted ABC-type ATPase